MYIKLHATHQIEFRNLFLTEMGWHMRRKHDTTFFVQGKLISGPWSDPISTIPTANKPQKLEYMFIRNLCCRPTLTRFWRVVGGRGGEVEGAVEASETVL